MGHIPFADPFDKQLSAVVVKAVGREGVLEGESVRLHEKGTIVCIGTIPCPLLRITFSPH